MNTERSEMDQYTISKETARRFLITKQGFHQEKEKTGTLEAIKRLECVQVDPVNVVHRNHHLVLHNRVSDYKPSYLEALLYKDRTVFEYWCNGNYACMSKKGGGMVSFRRTAAFVSELLLWPSGAPPPRGQFQ